MVLIEGNILDVKRGVICHQVNCHYVASAGLALQIRSRFPQWYEEFRLTEPELGKVTYFQATSGLLIANLYAQEDFGIGTRYTNYAALGRCLMRVRGMTEGLDVFIPYQMGCGLGGGDWDIVLPIIKDALPGASIVHWRKRISNGS